MYEERRQAEDACPHGGAKEKRKYVVVVHFSVKHLRNARRRLALRRRFSAGRRINIIPHLPAHTTKLLLSALVWT
jgi:hypothetical protein